MRLVGTKVLGASEKSGKYHDLAKNKMCRNAKYRHVEHCGDAKRDFLTGLSGDEEDEPEKWKNVDHNHCMWLRQMVQKYNLNEMTFTNILQCKYVDQNCRLYVVKEKEFRPSPY